MRVLLSAAALLTATVVWASAAVAVDLKVGDAAAPAGETVTVPIHATRTGGLGALQMRLVYDGKVLEVVEVTAGPILANALVEFKANANYSAVAFATPDPVTADGDLLLVKLRRKPGSADGSILLPENVRAWKSQGEQSLPVSLTAGHLRPLGGGAPAAGLSQWLTIATAGILGLAIGFVGAQILHRYQPGASLAVAAVTSVPQEAPKFCAACGTAIASNANFCINCGKKLH